MDKELSTYNYSEYYSIIRSQMGDKIALLTKDNCEIINETISFFETPKALLIKDDGYEEPLYLREDIEIIFIQDYLNQLPEIGLEKEDLIKNDLVIPLENPVRYILKSGKLLQVYSLEHVNAANSIQLYDKQNIPSFLWTTEQVEQNFPKSSFVPAGYYLNKVNRRMCPLFNVEKSSVEKGLIIYSDYDYYSIKSFLIGLESSFYILPKAWKINVHPDNMSPIGVFRGEAILQLHASAFEGSPLSKKLNSQDIEDDDLVCTLWDIQPIRDILNINSKKITSLIPKGITEEGLAVFSLIQDNKWLREKFHVFWAMTRFKKF